MPNMGKTLDSIPSMKRGEKRNRKMFIGLNLEVACIIKAHKQPKGCYGQYIAPRLRDGEPGLVEKRHGGRSFSSRSVKTFTETQGWSELS